MRIVTIMENIVDENYVVMCKVWLNQVKLSNPDEIIVLYNKNYPSFLDSESLVKLIFCNYDENIKELPIEDQRFRFLNYFFISFKLYNLYKVKPPFIHLDVDAIPIKDLNPLWNIKSNKPFLATGWQNIRSLKNHFLKFDISSSTRSVVAGGVLLVKDLSFMPYDELISMYEELIKDQKNHLIMQDDILMTMYFRKINYDFKHEDFSARWNFLPSCIVKMNNFNNKLKVMVRDDDKILEEGAIVHYTGVSKKPWIQPCKLYNYLLKKHNLYNI